MSAPIPPFSGMAKKSPSRKKRDQNEQKHEQIRTKNSHLYILKLGFLRGIVLSYFQGRLTGPRKQGENFTQPENDWSSG